MYEKSVGTMNLDMHQMMQPNMFQNQIFIQLQDIQTFPWSSLHHQGQSLEAFNQCLSKGRKMKNLDFNTRPQ